MRPALPQRTAFEMKHSLLFSDTQRARTLNVGADEAVIAAREVFALVSTDRQRLIAAPGASIMAIRLMDQLPIHPVVTILTVVKLLETTKPTAGKAVQLLENLGVLAETTGKQRDRTFAYARYLEKLQAGTEVDLTQ